MEPHHISPGGGNEPQGNSVSSGPSPVHNSRQLYESSSLSQSDCNILQSSSQRLARAHDLIPSHVESQPDCIDDANIYVQAWQATTPYRPLQSGFSSSDRDFYRTSAERSPLDLDVDVRQQRLDQHSYLHPAEGSNLPQSRAQTEEQHFVPNSSAEPFQQQRKIRCLKCKTDDGHRGCYNYPICDRCITDLPKGVEQKDLIDQTFLKWRDWYNICEELGLNHNHYSGTCIAEQIRDAQRGIAHESVSDFSISESMESVVLELSFGDRIRSTHHTVILRPREQVEMRQFSGQRASSTARAPAIDLTQLDAFVKKGVWGETLWNRHEDCRLKSCEQRLWYKVRLLIGYVSLNHNLATTSIQSLGYMPQEMQRRVAAELVYTIGWRLQMLWFEISEICLQLVSNEETIHRPVVTFYALEILYRLMRSMQQSNWLIPDQSPLHTLTTLQNEFNTRVEHVLAQICAFECVASGKSQSGRKFNHAPNLLSFARSAGKTPFPSHCQLTAYRHRNDPIFTPIAWDTSAKRRLVDVLGSQSDDSGEDTATDSPGSYLDDDNEAHTVMDLLPTSIRLGVTAGDTRAGTAKARKKNSGRPAVTAVLEVSSATSEEDMTTMKAHNGTTQGTPVPSLTDENSPMPLPSPTTPVTPHYTA